MNANKQLSKDALEVVGELKRLLKEAGNRVEVSALTQSGGYVWGCDFQYIDDEGHPIAEETFFTMKGATRRVSAFIVLFENGRAIDGEMQNFFLPESSKTLSEFIISVIGEELTPSLISLWHADLEESSVCDIGDDDDDEDDEDDDRAEDLIDEDRLVDEDDEE